MHKNWWIVVGIVAITAVAGIITIKMAGNEERMQAELDMKMDKYCTDNDGSIVSKNLGEEDIIKICEFSDGSSCEAEAFYVKACSKGEEEINLECSSDSDCVADSCCHAKGCVAKENAPDCKGIMCTMNCEPGTLDCGYGGCKCMNGKCEAALNE